MEEEISVNPKLLTFVKRICGLRKKGKAIHKLPMTLTQWYTVYRPINIKAGLQFVNDIKSLQQYKTPCHQFDSLLQDLSQCSTANIRVLKDFMVTQLFLKEKINNTDMGAKSLLETKIETLTGIVECCQLILKGLCNLVCFWLLNIQDQRSVTHVEDPSLFLFVIDLSNVNEIKTRPVGDFPHFAEHTMVPFLVIRCFTVLFGDVLELHRAYAPNLVLHRCHKDHLQRLIQDDDPAAALRRLDPGINDLTVAEAHREWLLRKIMNCPQVLITMSHLTSTLTAQLQCTQLLVDIAENKEHVEDTLQQFLDYFFESNTQHNMKSVSTISDFIENDETAQRLYQQLQLPSHQRLIGYSDQKPMSQASNRFCSVLLWCDQCLQSNALSVTYPGLVLTETECSLAVDVGLLMMCRNNCSYLRHCYQSIDTLSLPRDACSMNKPVPLARSYVQFNKPMDAVFRDKHQLPQSKMQAPRKRFKMSAEIPAEKAILILLQGMALSLDQCQTLTEAKAVQLIDRFVRSTPALNHQLAVLQTLDVSKIIQKLSSTLSVHFAYRAEDTVEDDIMLATSEADKEKDIEHLMTCPTCSAALQYTCPHCTMVPTKEDSSVLFIKIVKRGYWIEPGDWHETAKFELPMNFVYQSLCKQWQSEMSTFPITNKDDFFMRFSKFLTPAHIKASREKYFHKLYSRLQHNQTSHFSRAAIKDLWVLCPSLQEAREGLLMHQPYDRRTLGHAQTLKEEAIPQVGAGDDLLVQAPTGMFPRAADKQEEMTLECSSEELRELDSAIMQNLF